MPILLDSQLLNILGLDLAEVQPLSEEKQIKIIRKAWKEKCLQMHPDKHLEDKLYYGECFARINKAYTALTTQSQLSAPGNGLSNVNQVKYEIDNYFKNTKIWFPNTAFDIPMQEGILEAFENLKGKFSTLPNEAEKKQFAERYAEFLSLAEAIEARKNELTTVRANALVQQEVETFLSHEWRRLLIRLFAEEYLDDFQYRHALAFGKLLPILATRKLLSPVKWLAALLGGLDLLLCGLGEHYQKQGNSGASFFFYYIGAPVSVITYFIQNLASPVNQIARPLAAYTKLPPAVFTSLLSGVGAGVIYGLMRGFIAFSFLSAMALLPYCTIALALCSFYRLYQLFQYLKENEASKAGILLSIIFSFPILLNLIPSIVSPNPIMDSLFAIIILFTINTLKRQIQERPIEFLPLPDADVPEQVIKATLLGYTKANQSHLFFGTPPDAKYQNNRTIGEKIAGFLGMESTSKKDSPYFKENPMAIGYNEEKLTAFN